MAHRRRGVGVGRTSAASNSISTSNSSSNHGGSINNHHTTSILVQKKADEMKAMSLQNAITTLEILEIKLTQFAQQYQNEIKNDPIFRHRFLQMCAPLGIDVLASSKHKNKNNIFHSLFSSNNKGSGGSGSSGSNSDEYYYELAVKCAEVCLATQSRNGGIICIDEIQSILQSKKTKYGMRAASHNTTQITIDDIQIAIEQLSVLGGGFRIVQLISNDNKVASSSTSSSSSSSTTMVISVPTELDNDHMQILSIAQQEHQQHGITIDQIQQFTKWNETRIQRALDLLLQEGMAWIDLYHGNTYYWFTSLWQQQQQQQQL